MIIKGKCTNCESSINIDTGRAVDIRCASCGNGFRVYKADDNSPVLQARCLEHGTAFEVPMNEPIEACHFSDRRKCWKIMFEYSLKEAVCKDTKWAKKNKTAIVMLCWNRSRYTKACLKSIRRFTALEEYRLIVVDNGSTDDTIPFLRENLLEGELLIFNPRNVGFPKANNMALRHIEKEPYVLFLNNDTQVQESGWLKKMIRAMKRDKLDIVGPMCARCWLYRTVDTNKLIYCFEKEVDDPMTKLGYVEGWCLMARLTALKKLKGWDETFSPAYCEDSDLCWRAKEAGMKIGKVWDLPIIHYRGKTTDQLGNVPRLSEEMGELLHKRWGKNNTIVLRRKGAIGDVLMTTPIIRQIREKHPDAELLLATDCSQLIQGNPYLTGVIPYKQKVDVEGLLDVKLRYELEPEKNAIEVMSIQAGLNPKKISLKMDCFIGTQDNHLLKKANLDRLVTFHTGRSWPNREWSIENFKKTAKWLMKEGYFVVELGDGMTQTMKLGMNGRSMDARRRPWEHTVRWIRESQFFVGIDSAPANVAKAVGTPAFIIYGCTDPETRRADAEEYPLVVDGLRCAGCRNRTKAEVVQCEYSEALCVTKLTVSSVQETILQFLERMADGRIDNNGDAQERNHVSTSSV